jgi:acyl carrier protein
VNIQEEVRSVLAATLSLGGRAASLTETTTLLGSIPELDSMAVVNVITALEDRFDIFVADDEISADTFTTFGSLVEFVGEKVRAQG